PNETNIPTVSKLLIKFSFHIIFSLGETLAFVYTLACIQIYLNLQ
ncbi:hypothetical protein LCGC14_2872970, partial [marine sediment metagenome]